MCGSLDASKGCNLSIDDGTCCMLRILPAGSRSRHPLKYFDRIDRGKSDSQEVGTYDGTMVFLCVIDLSSRNRPSLNCPGLN